MKIKIMTCLFSICALSACGGQNNSTPSVTPITSSTDSATGASGSTSTVATGSTESTSTTGSTASGSASGSTGSTSSGGISTGGSPVTAPSGTIALVFSGNGACAEDCAKAGVDVATAAGLTPKEVTGNEINSSSTQAQIDAFFSGVRVWIMPGGVSNTEIASMSSVMQKALVKFISTGGGYVGWCAGAFAATMTMGGVNGIFPADSDLFTDHNATNSYGASIEKLTWQGTSHYFYLEGGPYLYNLGPTAEVIATYADGKVAAARAPYGTGRVFISGVHPEAPTWWWQGTSVTDSDGSDQAYAVDMVKWAAKME